MMLKKALLALLFVLVGLMACSENNDTIVLARYDESGVPFSPTEIQGSAEYLPSMMPEYFRIVTVDNKLNPLDSFELSPVDVYKFINGSRDYEAPYIKIVTVFLTEGKQNRMEFSQYMRISRAGNFSRLNQNLYAALAAKRIETLVRKEDYDFDRAKDTAFSEMGKIFGVDLSDVYGKKYDLAPFVYCRHEISDSVFYHDFMEFSESFAESGRIDSSLIIRAADAWLSTFEQTYENGRPRFKSRSRDKDYDKDNYSYSFFSKAYGIAFSWCDTCYAKILNKKSTYYGRRFICEYDKWNSNNTFFRLSSLLEDTLGLCKMNTVSLVEHGDLYYLCKDKESAWNAESERDTILKYKYGVCGSYSTENQFFYLKDSLLFCECVDGKCAWTDKYAKAVFNDGDSLYAEYLHATAQERFGKCDKDGTSKQLDSVFVQCDLGRWTQIDSLSFYLGHCSRKNVRGEHLGVYYGCGDFYRYGVEGSAWAEIPAPVYFDDNCGLEEMAERKVVHYGNDSFMCCSYGCVNDEYPSSWQQEKWCRMNITGDSSSVSGENTCRPAQVHL
ncbi:MAG: hypothetical protein IKS97_11250 [Fibrobacter sp.]|nr:hypothetical protein [Fibrobacter sp.]